MGKQHLAEQHQLPYSYDDIEDAVTSKFCKELVIGIDAMWKELVEKFNFLLGEVDNAFGVIHVSGETDVAADSPHDTVEFDEGTDIVITTNPTTSKVTFALSGSPTHIHDDRYYTETELDGGQLDNRYFRENEHIASSAGAGDAGKPIKLDAGGRIDDSMVEGSEVVKHALADAANDFLVASGADAFVKKTLAETGAILESDIQHDNLQGFVSDEHIDHSAVAVNAGGILSGGGNLTATRTISLAQADVDHDQTTNFVTEEHIRWDQTGAEDVHDDRIAQSSVTQHEAALTITESQISDLDHTDTDAFHDDVAAEIHSVAEKASPVAADVLLGEDSEASWAKKRFPISSLGGSASAIIIDDANFDKFFDEIDEGSDVLQDVLDLIDEQAVEVVQSASEPGTTYPGLIWIDTDADGGTSRSLLSDADLDTTVNVEASADEDIVRITTGGTEVANFQTDGITYPVQPAFQAQMSSNQANLTAGTGNLIEFDTEIVDQGSDYDNGTYTFTAPVDGLYQFSIMIKMNDVDTNHVYLWVEILTSNWGYYKFIDPNHMLSADSDYYTLTMTVLADMDANDTAAIYVRPQAGANITDVMANQSAFMGHLVC